MIYAADPKMVAAVFLKISRKRAFREQRGRCFWCNRDMAKKRKKGVLPSNQCTTEHLIPTAKGGTDQDWNIVAACNRCNNERGDMPADQWLLKIRKHIGEPHFAAVLQKLTKCGISVAIGHPEQSAPMPVTPDCPPPKEKAPAP